MSILEIKDFIFENYYKEIGFSKKNSYNSMKHLTKKDLFSLANKLIENIPDPCNAKERYQSFEIMKNKKISKTIRNRYLSTKTFSKPK